MKNSPVLIFVFLGILLVGGILFVMNQKTPDTEQPGATIAVADFAAVLASEPSRTLVDVRTPAEYAAGHIAGATNIDFYEADFQEQFASFDRSQPLAIYCRSGGRSGQALAVLQGMGFVDVIDLDGGIMAWENAGGEVE